MIEWLTQPSPWGAEALTPSAPAAWLLFAGYMAYSLAAGLVIARLRPGAAAKFRRSIRNKPERLGEVSTAAILEEVAMCMLLRPAVGIWPAALVFGLLHALGAVRNCRSETTVVAGFVSSCVLAVLAGAAWRGGGLLAAAAMHLAWNACILLVIEPAQMAAARRRFEPWRWGVAPTEAAIIEASPAGASGQPLEALDDAKGAP